MTEKFKLSRRSLLSVGTLSLGAGLLPGLALAQSISTIKSRGKILIGIQGDNPPWGFVDTAGAADGFDAVIGKAFAKFLGVDAEFVPLAVVNRIPALTTGRVDILFATMAMLPERAKVVQFSKPYVANIIQLVGAKATSIKTNADMKNVVIGVPRSSTQDTQALAKEMRRKAPPSAATMTTLPPSRRWSPARSRRWVRICSISTASTRPSRASTRPSLNSPVCSTAPAPASATRN